MKKTFWTITGAGCVLGIALAASAAALQQEDGLLSQHAAGLLARGMERRLNLTSDQREQIKAILRAEQPAIQSLAARVQAEREQMEAQPYDETTVRAFAQQHETTMEDVLVEREKVRAEIQAVLSPQQRKQAEEMRKSLYARFVERLSTLGDQL